MDFSNGYLIGVTLGLILAGALLGLIPFFVGRKRGFSGLGTAGLICCMVGSLIWIGSATFIAMIFTVVILIKSR